jgi:cell wall assembly regulator SMI1
VDTDPSREAAVAEVADVLAGKAIAGWARLVWRATLYAGGFQERLSVFDSAGVEADAGATAVAMGLVSDRHAREAATRLGVALRAADGAVWHAVELTVEPGRVEAVVNTVLTQSTGHLPPTYRVVVDAARRTQPEHGPDTGNPKAASGDPRRVVELAQEYCESYARLMGQPLELRPPATEEEIAAAEAELGVTFPADLRALYGLLDGEYNNYGLFGGPTFLALVDVVDQWKYFSAPDEDPPSSHDDHVGIEGHPHGTVRPVTWHPRWIPFGNGNDGNFFAVDLAPGPNGTVGQVIEFGVDYDDEPVTFVADSVTDLMADLLARMAAGELDVEPGEHFWVFPTNTQIETPDYSHRVTQESLSHWLATLSAPDAVQELFISDGDTVDLSPLAALPRLRILRLRDVAAVTGSRGLSACPLEQLTIIARQADLTDLNGHPALRFLTVRGVTEPALRLPATLPRIESLDVSASRVADLGVLTGYPTLRNLTLSGPQWTHLGDAQPPGLATAALTGTSSLHDAASWARRVAPATTGTHWEHSAALEPR